MNDRELLALMCASLYDGAMKEALVSDHAAAIAVLHARSILSEIDKSPAPEAGSDSASPSLTAVKRYENIDRAAKRVLSVFDVARSPHGAPSRVVEPDGATDALCALMDAVEGFAPPSRAETPTEADCAEAWYTAGTITCPEGLVRRTTTAGREITLSAQTWVRIAAVRALCLTAPPAGMDAAPVVLYDLEAVVDRLVRFLAPGTLSSAIVPALHDALQKHRLTPIAPPPATTAGAVDEIVREIDGIFHRWQTEAAPGTCMSDLHHAWNRLRAALSSRTAGEKALSYEEIVKAYVDGASERCPLPLSPTELMSWEECGLHAVHALVAQRGVR